MSSYCSFRGSTLYAERTPHPVSWQGDVIVAGVAATWVAERGIRAREIDVPELQAELTAQGMDLGLDELD